MSKQAQGPKILVFRSKGLMIWQVDLKICKCIKNVLNLESKKTA